MPLKLEDFGERRQTLIVTFTRSRSMKTNSYTRIIVLTFLFFSFSAIAQDTHAFNVERGTTKFICRWTAAHMLGSSKFKNACHTKARETKWMFATLCTRKDAGEEAN
jgi:hypothetical protein